MKICVTCAWCGAQIMRYPSQLKQHNFCSRDCLANFSSKEKNPEKYSTLKDLTAVSEHMSGLNRKMNPERMNFDLRCKLRQARLNTGDKGTYEKCFGRRIHRSIAEAKIGRALKPGEVVHHVDGNKRNNDPDNLVVFKSQADHLRWHIANGGGDST